MHIRYFIRRYGKVENYIRNYETIYYVGEDLLNQEEYNKYLDFFDKL